jgi:hypothetical protein
MSNGFFGNAAEGVPPTNAARGGTSHRERVFPVPGAKCLFVAFLICIFRQFYEQDDAGRLLSRTPSRTIFAARDGNGAAAQLRHCESGPIVLVLAPMANILRWHFACQLRETGKNQEPLITKFFT